MKRVILFYILILTGCGNPSSESTSSGTTGSANVNESSPLDIPADAQREKFSDAMSIEQITTKDIQGKLTSSGVLLNGKKEGTWTFFEINGMPKITVSYVDGMKEGISMEFGPNGQFLKRVSYHKNLKHGEYREYLYTNVKEERHYENDKLEGTVRIYYDNFKLMEESSYKNGTRDGLSRWYDQDGKVTIEYRYKNGELVK